MLDILLVIISIILIALILLQQRGTFGGSIMGGGTEIFFKRRGFESLIFKLTWAVLALFIIFSLIKIL